MAPFFSSSANIRSAVLDENYTTNWITPEGAQVLVPVREQISQLMLSLYAAGKAGHAMLLDCRDLSKQFVPLDNKELRVVIVNSMVRHELSEGEHTISVRLAGNDHAPLGPESTIKVNIPQPQPEQ